MQKLFISYSHLDMDKVVNIVSKLSVYDFDIWIDEKKLTVGDNYTSKILNALDTAGIYVVFLSNNSVKSKWVKHEINYAVTKKIDDDLIVIPLLLEKCDLPAELKGMNYLDISALSSNEVVEYICKNSKSEFSADKLTLKNFGITLSSVTNIEIGPMLPENSREDLDSAKNDLLSKLRQKMHGILLNFLPLNKMDWTSDKFKLYCGFYDERVKPVSGTFDGGIRERVEVEVLVIDPNEKKLKRIFTNNTDISNISDITFGFSLPSNNVVYPAAETIYQNVQDNYTILAYSDKDGMQIQVKDDRFVWVYTDGKSLRVKLTAKYDFCLMSFIKSFDIPEFLKTLLTK